MNLFAKGFRSKASQPAVCRLAIPYDMVSETSDSLLPLHYDTASQGRELHKITGPLKDEFVVGWALDQKAERR